MAEKKKKRVASKGASAPMDRWYAKTDSHAAIERQKKDVRGKGRGSLWPLHAQRTLGVMLLALGRAAEALRVLDEAANAVRATGKGDPWAVAASCAALAYWVREREGHAKIQPIMKFAEPAAHAAQTLQPELWTKARFAKEIASHWRDFSKGAEDDGELAVDTMAFHLAEIVLLRELHVLAPVHTGKVAARSTDAAVEHGLRAIEAKIAARAPAKRGR
jgi:hypothetical protein